MRHLRFATDGSELKKDATNRTLGSRDARGWRYWRRPCDQLCEPAKVLCNRRQCELDVWERLFRELAKRGRSAEVQMIGSTHIKAHRSASGAKRGSAARLLAARAAGEIPKSTPSQMLKAVFFPSC